MAAAIPDAKYTAVLTVHGSRDSYQKKNDRGYEDGVEPEKSGEVSKVVIRADRLESLYSKLQRHITVLEETALEDEI